METDCGMNEKEKTVESMNHGKAEAIVARLLSNAAGLRYGSVSVTAKLHEGRVVGVTYSTTENTRESEAEEAGSVKAGCQV